MRNKRISLLVVGALLAGAMHVYAQTKMPPAWQSSLVQVTEEGKLVYHPDEEGNVIPDFSRVGYHHGDRSIPVTAVTKTIEPLRGDNYAHIQQAIDELSALPLDGQGHRATLLLKRGIYEVSKTLQIKADGIVIRGEGSNSNETRLIATFKERNALIRISGEGQPSEVSGSRVKIRDRFVPVGTHKMVVDGGGRVFSRGDRVMVYRPATDNWIHDLKMDQIEERRGTRQWKAAEYNLAFEREVTQVKGDTIWIDNPVVMQMEEKYGGGEVYRYTFDGRISEVGVENLCLESVYNDYEDLNHAWIGVQVDKAENCWIQHVTSRYFAYSCVSLEHFAKNVTVLDCRMLELKGLITGGYRYSFNNNGQQNLFMNCQATEGRHDFVTGARTLGPNVFYNCTAFQTYADIGPHHRWSCGTLYDNIYTDGEINVQDRGKMGSGHGWAGVNQVLWNCRMKSGAIQNPWVSGRNYSIGTKGVKREGANKGRPEGVWEGQGETNVFPRSLYQAQLQARLSYDLKTMTK